jgi:hypothetical protein
MQMFQLILMFFICERHLHDCIISKTGEALANKTSLATKLIIERDVKHHQAHKQTINNKCNERCC